MSDRSLPIRAVTFDLDDTLWDIWPIVERAEQRLQQWLQQHYPRIPQRFSSLELRGFSREVAHRQPELTHNLSALRKQALLLAAQRVGYAEFQVELAFQVYFVARNEVVFFQEVLPVLEHLSQSYILGALTNGNADIHLTGLGELFDFAINAVDVGVAKPEPAMFQQACQRLDLVPEQIVHVGDDPEHDVLGAAQAGFRTVWVNRQSQEWPGGEQADAEVKSLQELVGLLEGWR